MSWIKSRLSVGELMLSECFELQSGEKLSDSDSDSLESVNLALLLSEGSSALDGS